MDNLTGQTIREYLFNERLAASGMANLYRARHTRLNRDVTIQVTPVDHPERFEKEARTLAGVVIQNVLPIYDFWTQDGTAYVVSPYLPGVSLEAQLKNGPLSLAQSVVITRKLAETLIDMHMRGIIHGGLNPASVLIMESGDVFLDLRGLVTRRLLENSLSATGTMAGRSVETPAYITPEQIRGEMTSDQTDLYMLGVLMYEMLTGKRPFQAESPVTMMMKHMQQPMPDVPAETAPADLNLILKYITAKEPNQRGSLSDFKEALAMLDVPDELLFFDDDDALDESQEWYGAELEEAPAIDDVIVPEPDDNEQVQPPARQYPPPAPAPAVPPQPVAPPAAAAPPQPTETKRPGGIGRLIGNLIDSVFGGGSGTPNEGDSEAIGAEVNPAAPPAPAQPALEAKKQEEAASPDLHDVAFTAYYPREVQPEQRYGLYVYAHLPEVLELTRTDAARFVRELGGSVPDPKTARKSVQLRRSTTLTIVPECDGVKFQPASLTKDWDDDWTRFDFDFRPEADLVGETLTGRISVMVSSVEIAHINFAMEVTNKPQQRTAAHLRIGTPLMGPEMLPENQLAAAKFMNSASSTPYHRIFISYSRKDGRVAEAYRLAQMALGNEVFMDTHSIRTGEDWRVALAQAIDSADIFQLFWSVNAAESEYVQEEWDYALRYKCPDNRCHTFIRPVYWDEPMPSPPDALSHLNFRFVPLE
ncbi:MAG: hypothetical protein OHK0046_35730 [Anaerolineae bacterium]